MATSITDFLIRVKVQGQQLVDKLTQSTNAAEKSMDNASKSAGKFGKAVKGMGGVISNSVSTGVGALDNMIGAVSGLGTAAAGIGLVATAFVGLGLKAMNAADAIQDISDATGISAGRLVNFKQSLLDAGGNAEDFEKIALKLTQTLGDAGEGNEKTRKSFKDLGISLGDANGKLRSTDELLPEIISALGQIENPAERSAKAVELLGKAAGKIDFTKVTAINDPFKDAEIAQLAKYQGAIDAIGHSVEKSLIGMFGRLAIEMQTTFDKAEKIEAELAKKGEKSYLGAGPRGFISSMLGMEPRTPIFTKKLSQEEQQANLMAPYKSRAGVGRDEDTQKRLTGELAITEAGKQAVANAKAQTDQMRQTNDLQNQYATKLNETLGMQQHQGDLARANLQIDFERDKKIADINKQIQTETNNKERDARVTAGIVAQLNDQVKLETAAADQRKIAKQDELTQLQRQKDLMSDIMLLNQFQTQDLQVKQLANQNSLIGLFGDELRLKQGTIAIENERMNAIMAANNKLAALGKNISAEDDARANREIAQAKTVADAKLAILTDQMAKEKALRENSSAGAQQALEAITRSMDPFQQAQLKVNSLWGNMSGAIDTFVDTGKFKFSDFARSVVQDLLKIELKAQATQLLKGVLGSGGSFLGSIFGFANGGNPPVGKPSIVGEKGPELFVPRTAGTIVPNNQLGMGGTQQTVNNNYVYNVSAIDARSVATFFAENRKTLLGTVQMAQKELPYGNR